MKKQHGRRTHEGGAHPVESRQHTQEGLPAAAAQPAATGHGGPSPAPSTGHGGPSPATSTSTSTSPSMAERGKEVASDASVAAHPSGAPEAGGATSRGSAFGGRSILASVLRAAARMARAVEAEAYRRLRDLDLGTPQNGYAGRPNRVRGAAHPGNPGSQSPTT